MFVHKNLWLEMCPVRLRYPERYDIHVVAYNTLLYKTECRVTLIQLQGLTKNMYACAQLANLGDYSPESNHGQLFRLVWAHQHGIACT